MSSRKINFFDVGFYERITNRYTISKQRFLRLPPLVFLGNPNGRSNTHTIWTGETIVISNRPSLVNIRLSILFPRYERMENLNKAPKQFQGQKILMKNVLFQSRSINQNNNLLFQDTENTVKWFIRMLTRNDNPSAIRIYSFSKNRVHMDQIREERINTGDSLTVNNHFPIGKLVTDLSERTGNSLQNLATLERIISLHSHSNIRISSFISPDKQNSFELPKAIQGRKTNSLAPGVKLLNTQLLGTREVAVHKNLFNIRTRYASKEWELTRFEKGISQAAISNANRTETQRENIFTNLFRTLTHFAAREMELSRLEPILLKPVIRTTYQSGRSVKPLSNPSSIELNTKEVAVNRMVFLQTSLQHNNNSGLVSNPFSKPPAMDLVKVKEKSRPVQTLTSKMNKVESSFPFSQGQSSAIDLSQLTNQVYQEIERKIRIERERRGL